MDSSSPPSSLYSESTPLVLELQDRLEDLSFSPSFLLSLPSLLNENIDESSLIHHWLSIILEIEILNSVTEFTSFPPSSLLSSFIQYLCCSPLFCYPFPLCLENINNIEIKIKIEEFLLTELQINRMIINKNEINNNNNNNQSSMNENDEEEGEEGEKKTEKEKKKERHQQKLKIKEEKREKMNTTGNNEEKEEENDEESEMNELDEELSLLCLLLSIPVHNGMRAEDALNLCYQAIDNQLNHIKQSLSLSSPSLSSIVDPPIFSPSYFSPTELSVLHDIYSTLYSDYSCRKQMLKTRLIVTIQSFVWSRKGKEKEKEIRKIMNNRMRTMKNEANIDFIQLFTTTKKIIDHALINAGEDRKIEKEEEDEEEEKNNNQKDIRDLLIGSVPDRGGRTNEGRTKGGIMPSFKQRQTSTGSEGRGGGGGNNQRNKQSRERENNKENNDSRKQQWKRK